MQDNDFLKQQKLIPKILWGALLFSNIIFGYLVYSGMLASSSSHLSQEILYAIVGVALIVGSVSIYIFNSSKNLDKLKKTYRSLTGELNKNAQMTPDQFEEFNKLSEHDRKIFNLRGTLFVKGILSLALAESINVLGISAVVMGMSKQNYFYFFAVAVGLTLMMFPRHEEVLKNVK